MTEAGMREYVGAMRERYQKASRTEKSRLLDEFCAVTGHHRKAAIRALNRTPREPGAVGTKDWEKGKMELAIDPCMVGRGLRSSTRLKPVNV